MATITKERLLDWYYQMVLVREFENACDKLYREKKITGVYLHLYSGHEASGVGALAALEERDHVITAYRDHGIALIRGISANKCMAEMMGKKTGTSGGKGGSMHLASREHNFWGGYAIVGGHLPLATGIALASKYKGTDEVTISFIGDGATNNGYFHEALNMSAIWDCPVVWIIENNLVGMGTRVEDASGQTDLHKRAVGYGMKDYGRVDAQNVVEVYETAAKAVAYARKNSRPVLIEHMTYRYKGHGVSDRSYDQRFEDELRDYMKNRDPCTIARNTIIERFGEDETRDELDQIWTKAEKVVEEAVEYALSSPDPDYIDLISNVYIE